MWLVDFISLYLYGLTYVAIGLAVIIFISGLDDLFIDIVYWSRKTWRALTVYRKHPYLDHRELYKTAEKPLAILSITPCSCQAGTMMASGFSAVLYSSR